MSSLRSIGGILRSSLVLDGKLSGNSTHTGTVIFLHGIGERGQLWNDILKTVQASGNQHIKFICPNSLVVPVSRYGSFPIRSWFNYKVLGDEFINDLNFSRATIQTIIQNEIDKYNIPSDRIILGGFGQGSALALYTFYTQKKKDLNQSKYILDDKGCVISIDEFNEKLNEDKTDNIHLDGGYLLGGCLSLSGYLPLTKYFKEKMYSSININKPLLMFHGDKDKMIDISIGEKSFEFLNNQGCTNSEFIIYKGLGDGVCDNQIVDISNFINKCLPNNININNNNDNNNIINYNNNNNNNDNNNSNNNNKKNHNDIKRSSSS